MSLAGIACAGPFNIAADFLFYRLIFYRRTIRGAKPAFRKTAKSLSGTVRVE